MPSKKILFIAIALSAFSAIITDYYSEDFLFRIFKPLTSILILLIVPIHGIKSRYSRLTLVALVFCLIGDIALLENTYFIIGLLSFLIAHLFFTVGFISIVGFSKKWIPLLFLSLFAIGYYIFLYPHIGELAIPVALYIFIILFMCWQGIGVYLSRPNEETRYLAIAVFLFFLSDTALAYKLFVSEFPWAGCFILTTYWLSISILANSTSHEGQKESQKEIKPLH